LVLYLGNEAHTVYIVAISVNLLMFFVRLIIVKNLIDLSLLLYFKRVVLPVLFIIFISTISALLLQLYLPIGLLYSILNIFLCVLVSSVSMYYIGLNKEWRGKIKNYLYSVTKKIKLS
ncbi:MAG: polysaccharide biosynthesis protein, partial [bacterium]